MKAREMAERAGLKPRLMYTIAETAQYTGINYHILLDEAGAGRLRCMLPVGKKRGRYVSPEDVDAWIAANSR
ncbi:helix-turn-helix domain-containing protein [uncultured Parolsenella sp.]|uniref:helix-turn-helix domain-containing protein n=1 Tax=uncultured Parolsenella sp. TaxID=2083008 RepID=UPI00260104D8|nr:helix-turn-helix domain-containing protein [uncultured Parolsenella sp.]